MIAEGFFQSLVSGRTGLASFSVLLAVGLSRWSWVLTRPQGHLACWVRAYHTHLDRELTFLRSPFSASVVCTLQGGLVVLALVSVAETILAALLLLIGVGAPPLVLRFERRKKVAAIDGQVHSFLDSLARALEAAPSLGEALCAARDATAEPLRHELEQTLSEMQLGLSLERALGHLDDRVESSVLSLALATLQVGRQTGGALPTVLKEAAASLREMDRLAGVVRTKTAEGKMQSVVIGGLPIPLYFIMDATDPHHFDPLRSSALGHVLVAVAVVLWMCALLAAKKILAVRI